MGGGGCAHLLPWCPSCFSFPSLPTPFPSLPTPSPPYSPLTGCVTIIHGRLRGCSGQEGCVDLLHLAEFQTPTILDHDFNLHCSIFYIFYGLPKTVKIIIYIIYIGTNLFTILT